MCWSIGATVAMVGLGTAATVVTLRRREAPVIPVTLGFFTLMEGLQLAGYLVIDQCGTPSNQSVTFLSFLHIVFQPLFINAFAMQLVPRGVSVRLKTVVFSLCALSSVVMLMQLYPFAWAGTCAPDSALCGERLCTVSGTWHLAWDVPYNGLLAPFETSMGVNWGFTSYMIAGFVLPLLYGAWRFVLFHALAGPFLAMQLTGNPNEMPAIWCLFSIGIILIALSPAIRRRFEGRPLPA
ncbi:DUF5765 domain-containing protein [Pararhodobacter sp. SW119]|uniref:DUF5765 domain-containing protein n=1 Tax=Pararhodobacter sp. SW119 TaxID=2780075 RepID=UPI001AE0B311|nr:DUF5765 domain-containing protein [Pararhodobacter sp. SW119]